MSDSEPARAAGTRRLRLLGALLAVAATGSACTAGRAPAEPTPGLATIRAYGGGAGNAAAMAFKPIGMAHDVSIQTVDGVTRQRYGDARQVRLPPGRYQIAVQCGFNVDFRLLYLQTSLSADVVAGHRYEIDGALTAETPPACAAHLSDLTPASP